MRKIIAISTALLISISAIAQVDTLNTSNNKMNTKALKEGKATYAVFWTDSLGKHFTSADLWERNLTLSGTGASQQYTLQWKMWRRDTAIAEVTSIGYASTLAPISHSASYKGRGDYRFEFANNKVTIPDGFKKNAKDSAFNLQMDPPAFAFPMDLEIMALLPIKKAGQAFAIAFYEPGTASSKYYNLTVTGKEDLKLPGNSKLSCWLLRIDYGQQGSYATFWISDATREVVKVKEFFRGRWREKVRLY